MRYKNSGDGLVLLKSYVFEAATTGNINLEALDAKVPDKEIPAERDADGRPTRPTRVEIRRNEPARQFSTRMARDLDPELYAEDWKTKRHLSALPSGVEWAHGSVSVSELIQRMLEAIEVSAVHTDKLLARIKALEATLP